MDRLSLQTPEQTVRYQWRIQGIILWWENSVIVFAVYIYFEKFVNVS
jgi:hypothetical protein